MTTQNKPRICEVLGIEVGEEFEIDCSNIGPVKINESGNIVHSGEYIAEGTIFLSSIINHPERIIRKPQFTPDDLELLRHIRAVFGIGSLYRTGDRKLWVSDGNYTLELPRNILNCIKHMGKPVNLDQVLKEGDPNEKAEA